MENHIAHKSGTKNRNCDNVVAYTYSFKGPSGESVGKKDGNRDYTYNVMGESGESNAQPNEQLHGQ